MADDTYFWPKVLALAECLCQQVTDVCSCGVLAGGLPVLDFCSSCDVGCGQAWVRLVQVVPTPVTTGTVNPCTAPLEATVEVGVARCTPMPDDNGTPPTMADQLESAQQHFADMAASLRAIRCCDAITAKDLSIVSFIPFGPDGGCVGGAWQITLFGA